MKALIAGAAVIIVSALAWFGFMHAAPVSQPQLINTATTTNATTSTQGWAGQIATSSTPGSATTIAASEQSLPVGSPFSDSLPLGDGKYTTSGPKQGYIYLCHVASGGQGAQGTPTWIHGTTWDPSEKVAVEGSISWPQAEFSMSISGSTRTITSNDLPTDHTTGVFPIQSSDPAYQFDRNPNSIAAQSVSYSLPAYPNMQTEPGCIYGQVGIMTDGVALFDGFDAEYRDAVAHETQDDNDGHPDASSKYHYHGFELGPLNEPVSAVVGFAFDGYPITGGKLPSGNYLTTADLDECHGITSAIVLDGKTVTTYHYVLTQDFPYTVSCFRGTSYEPKPGAGEQSQQQQTQSQPTQQGSGAPQPPQAAIDACAGKSSGVSCTVSGGPSGTCKTPPGQSSLVCVPQ